MKKLIVITGSDGSGKDTQIQLLRQHYEAQGIGVFILKPQSLWKKLLSIGQRSEALDPLGNQQITLDDFISDLSRETRLLLILASLNQELFDANVPGEKSIFIVNSYWFKYLAMELTMGPGAFKFDWSSLLSALNFPEPSVVFHLVAPPEVRAKRKEKITRYECGFRPATFENFLEFQRRLDEEIKGILPVNTVWLNSAEDSPIATHKKIVSTLLDGSLGVCHQPVL